MKNYKINIFKNQYLIIGVLGILSIFLINFFTNNQSALAQPSGAPSITVIAPLDGSTTTNTVTVIQVQTNIASVCKFVFNRNFPSNFYSTTNNNLYTMTTAGSSVYHNFSQTFPNNQTNILRIKCASLADPNAISNEVVVNFTVGQLPDNTPPVVEIISPANNSQLQAGTPFTLTVKTDEIATCRWGTGVFVTGYGTMSINNTFTASAPNPSDNNKVTHTVSITRNQGSETYKIACQDISSNQNRPVVQVTYNFSNNPPPSNNTLPVTITANPSTTTFNIPNMPTAGQGVNISWSSVNSSSVSCGLSSASTSNANILNFNDPVVNNSGNRNIAIPRTVGTYTLTVDCGNPQTGASGTAELVFTVTNNPNPVPVLSASLTTEDDIEIDFDSIPIGGVTVTIDVAVTNATYCSISSIPNNDNFNFILGGVSSNPNYTNSFDVTIEKVERNNIFNISCDNPSANPNNVTDSLIFIVTDTPTNVPNPVSIDSFTASPTSVQSLSTPVTLQWSTTNAIPPCSATSNPPISNFDGNVPVSSTGTQITLAGNNQTLRLRCTGAGANNTTEQTINVTVTPPSFPQIALSANPSTITTAGGSSTINWTITSQTPITSCTVNQNWPRSATWPGAANMSGSITVSPTTNMTYTVTCTNSAGQSSQSTTVFYNVASGPGAVSIETFTANPTTINQGRSSNLNWIARNATNCTLTGGGMNYSSPALNNSRAVSPDTTTTYTLTCIGANNTQESATVEVTVNADTNSRGGSSGNQGNGLAGFILVPDCSNRNDINDLVDPNDPGKGVKIACDFDDLIELIKNFIDLMILFITPIVLIIAVVTGFKYLTSGGNTSAAADAKQKFGQLAIGIAIMLLAWLAVATVLRFLGVPEAYSFLNL